MAGIGVVGGILGIIALTFLLRAEPALIKFLNRRKLRIIANPLSALYPTGRREKRLLDATLQPLPT